MKITKAETSSKKSDTGTTFYRIPLEALIDAHKDSNIWIQQVLASEGFEAIDLAHSLFGSRVIDDILYLCITDGYDIEVEGNEVDPESALDYYNPETELADYVKPGPKSIILENITEYELNSIDFNAELKNMLDSGYDFIELMRAAVELYPDILD